MYRYAVEGSVDPISVVAGLVQTGLYADFFYVYFTKYVLFCNRVGAFKQKPDRILQGQKFELPA